MVKRIALFLIGVFLFAAERSPVDRSYASASNRLNTAVDDESIPVVLLLQGADTDQSIPEGIFSAGVDGSLQEILASSAGHTFSRYEDGVLWLDNDTARLEIDPQRSSWQVVTAARTQTHPDARAELEAVTGKTISPLYGPIAIDISHSDPDTLYLMSGETMPFVDFYALLNGELRQLTDVITLFWDFTPPILSASVEFIALRPGYAGFLYRARLRDSTGTDFNKLFFYDFAAQNSIEMPFFGTDPVWSPDGMQLAGSRLGENEVGLPLYSLWVVDLRNGSEREIAPGCNPQWSPEGAWLAYDVHVDARWQGYIDCFASGDVEGIHLQNGERILFSDSLSGFVTLIGWRP